MAFLLILLSTELSANKCDIDFGDYPVDEILSQHQSGIRKIDFAGRYRIVYDECDSGCVKAGLVYADTGYESYALPDTYVDKTFKAQYEPDSRLMIITGQSASGGAQLQTRYYLFDEHEGFILKKTVGSIDLDINTSSGGQELTSEEIYQRLERRWTRVIEYDGSLAIQTYCHAENPSIRLFRDDNQVMLGYFNGFDENKYRVLGGKEGAGKIAVNIQDISSCNEKYAYVSLRSRTANPVTWDIHGGKALFAALPAGETYRDNSIGIAVLPPRHCGTLDLPHIAAVVDSSAEDPDGPGPYEFTCPTIVSARASSTLTSQGNNTYEVSHLLDYSREAAWVEGGDGDGLGQWVEFTIKRERGGEGSFWGGFQLVNGYGKNPTTWKSNNRVKRLQVLVNDTPIAIVELKDVFNYQRFKLPSHEWNVGDRIRFVILSVSKGTKYNDTVLSDFNPACSP